MTKNEQIEAKKLKPIEVGDYVRVEMPYTSTSLVTTGRGKNRKTISEETNQLFVLNGYVKSVSADAFEIDTNSTRIPLELSNVLKATYEDYSSMYFFPSKFVFPTFYECGANPFAKEKRRIQFYNKEVGSILFTAGYGRRVGTDFSSPQFESNSGGINFNPYVLDANKNRQYYQRGLVWTTEQKQLLIDSIYQGIEIGKILLRYNTWDRIQEQIKETGHGYYFDCVDGKQRFFAILEFLQNKYPDSNGNFWDDLSPNAQNRLLNYPNLSYGELPETATDQDVIDNFLTLNFTGTPMSKEHIDFVKSIKMNLTPQ